MNLPIINQYLSAIALLVGIANALWLWLSRPAADMKTRIDEVDGRVDEVCEDLKNHDRRIQRVEDGIAHLPTKDDFNGIKVEMQAIITELTIVSRVVERMDSTLRAGS